MILSIHLPGIAAGVGNEDINILYDRATDRLDRNYRFDDLTPMTVVPEPATMLLTALALCGLGRYTRRRRA